MGSRRTKVVIAIITILSLFSLGLLPTGMLAQDEGGPPAGPPGGGPGGPPGAGPGGPPGMDMPGGPGGAAPAAASGPPVGLPDPPLGGNYPQLPDFEPAPNTSGGMVAADVQQWHLRARDIMAAMRDAENAEIRAMVGPADLTRWPDEKAADPKAVNKPVWDTSLSEAIKLRNDAISAAAGSSGGYDGTRMAHVRSFNADRARLDAAQTPWVGLNMMQSLITPWQGAKE